MGDEAADAAIAETRGSASVSAPDDLGALMKAGQTMKGI